MAPDGELATLAIISRSSSGSGKDEDLTTAVRKPELPTSSPPAGFVLEVIAGADVGQSHFIEGRALVGQSPACDLQLTDVQVSRRHLSCEQEGGALRVRDLSSSNGTRANGVTIVEVVLRGGEQLSLGESVLRVRAVSHPPSSPLPRETSFGRVLGASTAMRRLFPLCARLAGSTVPLVIEGETGTGKELVAEAMHETGPRARGPFVVFDCTAVPDNLVEAALFGHERGAFTGAIDSRKGVFEQAHGGTLLIDEIGDLDIALQAKLLRAIERSEVKRVGGDRFLKVDVRIIAATRRDLDHEVQAGRFRDDLFYRLAVARLELPPLRKREGDVELLALSFWRSIGGAGALPRELERRIADYAWPGNVRELYNTVSRYVALGDLSDSEALRTPSFASETKAKRAPDASLASRALPIGEEADDVIGETIAMELSFPAARRRVVERFERRYLAHVLDKHGGNVAKAAAAAGVARRYFQFVRARQRG